MNMMHKFLIVFCILCSLLHNCESFKPLGSDPPDTCSITDQNCPSHYLCVRNSVHEDESNGYCICNRLFGFYGFQCRQMSFAGYLFITLILMMFFMAFWALSYNIFLLVIMYEDNKIKMSKITSVISMCFSTLTAVSLVFGPIVTFLMAIEVDRDMIFYDYQKYFITLLFICSFLSFMSISLYWIELVNKIMNRTHQSKKYKFISYVIAVVYAAMVIVSNVPGVGVFGIILTGYSYYYGGNKVVNILKTSTKQYEDGSLKKQHVLGLAGAVEITHKAMTKYSIWTVVAIIGTAMTTCTPTPIYPQQNSLPRYLQSQVFRFMVAYSMMMMDLHIVMYYHFVLFRDSSRFVPLKDDSQAVLALIHYFLFGGVNTSTVDVYNEESRPTFPAYEPSISLQESIEASVLSGLSTAGNIRMSSNQEVSGVYMIAPQRSGLYGENRIMRVAVPRKPLGNNESELQIGNNGTNDSGVALFMPLVLVTLNPNTNQTVCRTVVDYGDGNFVDIDESESSSFLMSKVNEEGGEDEGDGGLGGIEIRRTMSLSEGSHAFIRCYGECFLRCTLESFEFGSAGGHPLLANFSEVLMAGEVEVDAQGVVTRWLNKSGLYMPPRFIMGQAGLPFDLAWVYMSHEDVSALDSARRLQLEESGSLVMLRLPYQKNNRPSPSPTSSLSAASEVDNVLDKGNDTKDSTIVVSANGVDGGLRVSSAGASAVKMGIELKVATKSPMSIHAMDTWIVKASDDVTWMPTISSVAYQSAKESIGRFERIRRRAGRKIRRLRGLRRGAGQVAPMTDVSLNSHSTMVISSQNRRPSDSSASTYESVTMSSSHRVVTKNKEGGSIDREVDHSEFAHGADDRSLEDEAAPMHSPSSSKQFFDDPFAYEEEKIIRAKVKAMKREMIAAGVFAVQERGASERSKHKQELGFSKTMKL